MKPEPFEYVRFDSTASLCYGEFNRSAYQRNRLGCLIDLINRCSSAPRELRILEVGCGIGNICIPLAKLGYRIKGIDIDPASIEVARRNDHLPSLRLEVRAVEDESVADYDVIILTEVLEHIRLADDFLRGIVQRMRAGSHLIVTVPNGYGVSELLLRPAYWLKTRGKGAKLIKAVRRLLRTEELTTANGNTPHVRFFTIKRLVNLFNIQGLQVQTFARFFVFGVFMEWACPFPRIRKLGTKRDFKLSQKLPPALCANWAFLIEKLQVPQLKPVPDDRLSSGIESQPEKPHRDTFPKSA